MFTQAPPPQVALVISIDFTPLCSRHVLAMLLLKRPNDEWVRQFLQEQQNKPLSYSPVSGTLGRKSRADCKDLIEQKYDVDHYRVKLGEGEACFHAACEALRQWRQHIFASWVQILFPDSPIVVGTVVGILASHAACWSLSVCKIVYVVDEMDEDGSVQRFGFAYGTTETHVERGEERFLVEWNREDNSVYYDLFSFSQPQHWWVRMGYPVARFYQGSFASGSVKAMQQAVQKSPGAARIV